MLVIPSYSSSIASIIGIDPGSSNLGIGIIYYDVKTFQIVGSKAFTLNGAKLGKGSWVTKIHGDRAGRINALGEALLQVILNEEGVTDIVSESPFMSRFAQAFASLTEVVAEVRRVIINHFPWLTLHLIDPPSVKNAVGAKGNADKDEVKTAISNLPGFVYNDPDEFMFLDEHSTDALAVAYSRYKVLKEYHQCLPPFEMF